MMGGRVHAYTAFIMLKQGHFCFFWKHCNTIIPKVRTRNKWDRNIQSNLACCWWPEQQLPYTPPSIQPSHEIHWSRDILAACAATEGPKPWHDNVGILRKSPNFCAQICGYLPQQLCFTWISLTSTWMFPGNNITSVHHPPNSQSTSSKKYIDQLPNGCVTGCQFIIP